MDGYLCLHQNLYVKVQISNLMVSGGEAFGKELVLDEVMRVESL